MPSHIVSWLVQSDIIDDEQTRLRGLLNPMLRLSVFLIVLDAGLALVLTPETIPTLWLNIMGAALCFALFWLMRRGQVYLAGGTLCVVLWVFMVCYVVMTGGLASSGLAFPGLLVVVGFILFGAPGAIVFGLLNLAAVFGLYLAARSGVLSVDDAPSSMAGLLANYSSMFIALTLVTAIGGRSFHSALRRIHTNDLVLAERNQVLQQEIVERKRAEASIRELNQDLHRHTKQLIALNEINRDIATLSTLEGTLRNVLEKLKAILPLDAFFVILYDKPTNSVSYPLMYDSGRFWHTQHELLEENTMTSQVLENGTPLLVNRTTEEIAIRVGKIILGDSARISASIVYAPLMLGGQIIGVISAHSYELNTYDESHRDLLMGSAYQIAIAVHNSKLYENIQTELSERKRAEQEFSILNAYLEDR
ncbi:MAG: GAF domain-containing protein, partial [Chitinophagaceae bacterium]|nr:GAF domain-containing protein [Anaerolineae bacterium]